jgi:hypothetical protein
MESRCILFIKVLSRFLTNFVRLKYGVLVKCDGGINVMVEAQSSENNVY